MDEVLVIETNRNGYSISQVRETMTVGELIDFLGDYDEDMKVYLSFDKGYTYGGITEGSIDTKELDD